MKSPIKIILILFGLLQLIVILYLAIPSLPKKLQTTTGETSYLLQDLSISFDLDSDEYEILSRDGNLEDGRNTITLGKPNSEDVIYVSQVLDSKYCDFVEDRFATLQNPFKSRFAINLNRKGIKESYAHGTMEQQGLKTMKINIYKGGDRKFILTQFIFNDGSINYTAEGKIGQYYYSIDPTVKSDPEPIFKFMETATIVE
jgi:hypothetical protein